MIRQGACSASSALNAYCLSMYKSFKSLQWEISSVERSTVYTSPATMAYILCQLCKTDILAASPLYKTLRRDFATIEKTEIKESQLKIYHIIKLRKCSHFHHSLCFYKYVQTYKESPVQVDGIMPIYCPASTCRGRMIEWKSVEGIEPAQLLIVDGKLVRVSEQIIKLQKQGLQVNKCSSNSDNLERCTPKGTVSLFPTNTIP